MVTDLDLARLAAASYNAADTQGIFIDWGDIRALLVNEDDGSLTVTIRGTVVKDMANWITDAEAWPARSRTHPQLGLCDDGFLSAAEGILPYVAPHLIGRQVRLNGHSLGGAVAVLLAGLLAVAKTPAISLVTWEAPRAGGPLLFALLLTLPIRQYKFGNDPVPDVPCWPGIYEHMRSLTAIGQPMLYPLECHDINRIVAWLAAQPVQLSGATTPGRQTAAPAGAE